MLMRSLNGAVLGIAAAALGLVVWPLVATASDPETEAPDLAVLQEQMAMAEKGGEYQRAVELAEQMVEITLPQHVDLLYNLARLHNLTGDRSEAYRYLYWATDSGFWDRKRMMEDEAFENIRDEELFQELARKAWSNGYLWMLERDQREEYQQKKRVLEALDLRSGQYVVDVGAGSGYFTIPIARIIGPRGTLLATDIKQEMLDYIKRRSKIEQLDNIELLLAKPDDPMLPPGKADLILMVDVYHYIKERTAFGEKLREGLAPGGRLVVIDFIPKPWEERPWGPPPSQRLSEETLSADLARAGLKVVEKYDFISEQFFVVYEAK
jgi:ubiquinone/menaquinone biosynthesis C-methylase UbiE